MQSTPVCLTADDIEKFCERMKGCEIGIENLKTLHVEMGDNIDKILAQTIKTNGRVGKLENWRFLISGGLGVIVVLMIPILLILIEKFLNVR